LGSLDDRIEAHTQMLEIKYDKNDQPLSKQMYRFSEIKEDA
jgi:hypothetical protein